MIKGKIHSRKTGERQPIQSRGIRTREKIIHSGEKLFSRQGFHAVLADNIAKEAGVSVGSFYAYFKDKYDLFLTILDRHLDRITAVVFEWSQNVAWQENIDTEAFIRDAVQMSIRAHRDAAPFLKQATQMAISNEVVRSRLTEKTDEAVMKVFEKMLLRLDNHPNQDRIRVMSYVLYHASEGVIHDIIFNEGNVSEKEVIDELSKLLTAYINGIMHNS